MSDRRGEAFFLLVDNAEAELKQPVRNKTVRDVSYMLKPYSQRSIRCFTGRTGGLDADAGWSLSLFDFNQMNFGDLSFFCSTTPITERTRRKERRAEVFQVKVQNDALGTQMGLLGIEITYKYSRKTR